MLARFLHDTLVRYNYENYRSKPYKRQHVELEHIEHFDTKPFMQKRSSIILRKADGLSLKKVAETLSCSEPMVNRWVKRSLEKGVGGLRNKPGQGAKPIMDSSEEEAEREAIKRGSLSVMKAKEGWQQPTGKEACRNTYRAFLSTLA